MVPDVGEVWCRHSRHKNSGRVLKRVPDLPEHFGQTKPSGHLHRMRYSVHASCVANFWRNSRMSLGYSGLPTLEYWQHHPAESTVEASVPFLPLILAQP